jgi:predicted nucleotide-binding protein
MNELAAIPKGDVRMNEIELVQSLIDEINELPHRDEEKLDALRRRAEMIIRKVFGESSKYLKDLNNIHFFPMVYPAEEHYYNESWLSGRSQMLNLFNTMLEELKLFGVHQKVDKVQKTDVKSSNRIFIVHGHDEAMKQAVARTVEKIGLEPIILHEKPSEGRTIIEKFTDYSDVSFAIVLLSPDDVAYPKDQSPKDAKLRARQNVIFELGFFIGKLGRNRVLVLYQEEKNFEMPSDYSGVLYTPYDDSGRWQFDLVKELKACGYNVDANKLL